MVNERFPKADRLLERRNFSLAGRYGNRRKTKGIILLVHKSRTNPGDRPRLGITASRKVGKAHDRNRLKRLCREYFRTNKPRFVPGLDYVVIFRKDHGIKKMKDLEARFELLLEPIK